MLRKVPTIPAFSAGSGIRMTPIDAATDYIANKVIPLATNWNVSDVACSTRVKEYYNVPLDCGVVTWTSVQSAVESFGMSNLDNVFPFKAA